ncbi:S8 family peptidase [Streptomyces sp. NPDC005195]|uniref:S8 family peptidase n=1 Tax=Streptomyces sp. NPDC005195 TaxID=3154561 RepID=UPI0033ABA509
MRRQVKRACAATVATAAAVALAAGMTSPASARVPAKAGHVNSASGAGITAKHRITLITGDRVVVDAKGRVVGLERAKGRAQVPVQIRKAHGHTLVVPADAQALIAAGKVDRRLFDVTELNKAATRASQKQGLKVIVGYKGAATAARAGVREAGTLRRTLKSLNADAVRTPQRDAAELWSAVTDHGRAASGIAHVWLDGVRRASLDKSVPQIGAPKAWAAGYDGKGVKIAVLDTGVDATHPDLRNQVIASRNFSGAADATDHYGHGTHVASIAAGTGAKSNGKYKGVAPGAKILNGKVLDDTGNGDDSGILAGMEWAADQGADVVNLSLGGPDTPDVDPLEAEVDKLSAEKGILFAIAAGNEGPESIGSPGSADAALTVGAVDDHDRLADFSSTGPRLGDGAIKPDVTAPGVDITAAAAPGSVIDTEVGEKPAGYLTISGTSMATPHVAGAAAILKQEHPDWTYTELKGALTGSAKGGPYTPFQQGAGRIAVDSAIKQTVIADPSSVSFGVARWPHADDTALTRQLTYRNLGTKDVTLTLGVKTTDPKGHTAPSGFFELAATTLTVPAGGEASVGVDANTRLGGTLDGAYAAYVTATGGGQSVRTAVAVEREPESYDVTLKYVDRAGQTPTHLTDLEGYTGLGADRDYASQNTADTVTLRVPKGKYLLNSLSVQDLVEAKGGVDWLVRPRLDVTGNTTLTLDARTAEGADITVPDARAEPLSAVVNYFDDTTGIGIGLGLDSFRNVRVAHLGPALTPGLFQSWAGQWTKGASAEYDTFTGAKVSRLQGAHVKHYKASELAKVRADMGGAAAGKTGAITAYGYLPDDGSAGIGVDQKLPSARTLYLSAGEKVQWAFDFEQHAGKDATGFPVVDAYYTLGVPQTFKAGTSYTKRFNTAVFGPKISADFGVFRDGDNLVGYLPLYADGSTHAGSSLFSSVTTTLYRNGTKVGSNDDPLFGEKEFKVPAALAEYRLTTSVKRSVKVAAASTRIDASWTFKSKRADFAKLPASTVRFNAATGLDSRVEAGKKVTVPLTVQGSAAGRNLKSLYVYVSYDYGQTWTMLKVKDGKITVKNPAKGKGISFHAKITDKQGNKSTVSIYNAYYGK